MLALTRSHGVLTVSNATQRLTEMRTFFKEKQLVKRINNLEKSNEGARPSSLRRTPMARSPCVADVPLFQQASTVRALWQSHSESSPSRSFSSRTRTPMLLRWVRSSNALSALPLYVHLCHSHPLLSCVVPTHMQTGTTWEKIGEFWSSLQDDREKAVCEHWVW